MSDRQRGAIDALEFVVRTPSRVRILELLHEEGPVSRSTLRSELDVVRTTLQRNLTGLAERGLLRERERTYELTSAGELVTAGLSGTLDRIDAAMRLRPVLERLPSGTFAFDLDRLLDATVVESTAANPYAPVDYHAASLADADRARLTLPATGHDPLEQARDALDAGATVDLVVTDSVAEAFRSEPPIADAFASIADSDGLTVSVAADEIPFYLGIVDDAVQFGVHDESDLPTALLETTDDRVTEWADERFERLTEQATPLSETS